MSPDTRRMFRQLLTYKHAVIPDFALMLLLADSLEDEDSPAMRRLAPAYRWAGEHRRWPFMRHDRHRKRLTRRRESPQEVEILNKVRGVDLSVFAGDCRVYDWHPTHTDIPTRSKQHALVPDAALVPAEIGNAIKNKPLSTRRYGGIARAFVLLADALEVLNGGER